MPYFVNGLGGRSIYQITDPPIPESQFAYNDDYGAQRLTIEGSVLTVTFFDVDGVEIDSLRIEKDC